MADSRKKNNGKFYEETVHQIYKELEPLADVRINDRIWGRDTEIERQIDVSVRAKIADHDILIVIQVKDYKIPADVNIIGAFEAVIKDVGAQKGIIVCKSSFTKAAITQGKNLNIDLLSTHEALTKDIVINYKFPTVKETIHIQWEPFSINSDEIVDGKLVDGMMSEDVLKNFFDLPLLIKSGENTSFLKQFYTHWDKHKGCTRQEKYSFDFEGGVLDCKQKKFQVYNFTINFSVQRSLYLKYMRVFDFMLLKNHISKTERMVTLFTKEALPLLNDGSWELITNPNDISINSPNLFIEIFYFAFGVFKRLNFARELNLSQHRNYELKLLSVPLPEHLDTRVIIEKA